MSTRADLSLNNFADFTQGKYSEIILRMENDMPKN